MLGIADPLTYLLGTIAIILLPGPNSIFVLTTPAGPG
jgi:leucine efflux protein